MNETEARIRCLELAADIQKCIGNYTAEGIVEFATTLYTFTQTPAQPVKAAKPADKPKPAKSEDILG